MTVSFLNKVYRPNKKKAVGRVLRLLILIILILASLRMLFEGFNFPTLFIILFGVTLVIPRGRNYWVDDIPTRIEFSDRELEVYYMNIDRHDKRGLRTEHYTVQYRNIQRISYDEKSNKFCISCLADTEIDFADGNGPEDGRRPSPNNTEIVLYPTEDVKNRLTEKFTQICENQEHLKKTL